MEKTCFHCRSQRFSTWGGRGTADLGRGPLCQLDFQTKCENPPTFALTVYKATLILNFFLNIDMHHLVLDQKKNSKNIHEKMIFHI
jgi:hypothetical protein